MSTNEKKKKFRYKTLTLLVFVLLFIVFLCGIFSPAALRHIWFPIAMKKAGLEGSVGHISYSPWTGNGRFLVNDLKCSDRKTGIKVSIEHVEAGLDLYSVLTGKPKVDSVFVRNASIRSEMPSDPGVLARLSPMFPAFLEKRIIQRISIRAATFTGLTPETNQRFSSSGTLHLKGGGKLPVRSEIHFSLNNQWLLQHLIGNITVSGGEGTYDDYSLNQTSASVLTTCELTSEKEYVWDVNAELCRFDIIDKISVAGNGQMSVDEKKGQAKWKIYGNFASPSISSNGVMRWISDFDFEPQELKLSNSSLAVSWDAGKVEWTIDADADWEKIYMKGEEMLKKGHIDLVHSGYVELPSGRIHFVKASLNAASTDSSLTISEIGEYTLSRDLSGVWQVQGNKLKEAAFSIRGQNIPAKFFNPLLPFDFSGGKISGDWITSVDWTQGQVYMTIDLNGKGIRLQHSDASAIEPEMDYRVRTKLHSNGLRNISFLTVDKMDFECSENSEIVSRVDMKGNYTFQDQGLTLTGDMTVIPYALFRHVPLPLPQYISGKLVEAHGEKLENRYSLQIKYAPKISPVLHFNAQSTFDPLPLLRKDWDKNAINLQVDGTVQKTEQNKTLFSIRHASLESKGLCRIDGNAVTEYPSGKTNFDLNIKNFSSDLLSCLLEFFLFPDKTTEPYVIPQLKYDNVSATAKIALDPVEKKATVSGFNLRLSPDGHGYFHLKQSNPMLVSFNELLNTGGLFHVSAKDVPFTWFNCFVKPGFPFNFRKGVGAMEATVTMKDLSDVVIEPKITGKDFGISLYDTDFIIDDGLVSCNISFHNLFKQLSFNDLYFSCMRDKKEFAGFTTTGKLNFEFQNPDVHSSLDFHFRHMSNGFLLVLFGRDFQNWPQKNFSGSGDIHYEGWNCFDSNDFSGKLKIHNWEFMPDDEYIPLHGNFDFCIQDRIGLWGFENTSLKLCNKNDHIIFDLFLNGVMQMDNKKHSHYDFKSSGMNIPFVYSVYAKTGKTEKTEKTEGQTEGNENKGFWTLAEEPDLTSWQGAHADFNFAIRDWILTPWQIMSLNGQITRSASTLTAKDIVWKLNDSVFHIKFDADFADKDGLVYNANLNSPLLSVTDVIHIGDAKKLEKDGTNMTKEGGKELSGMLENLSLELHGRGLSLKNLDKNFHFSLTSDVKKLSIPFTAKDSSWMLRIILLPLELLPEAVDLIPKSPVRTFFENIVGDTIPVLTGHANIEFDQGHVDMFSNRSDIHIRKVYFLGPKIKTRIEQGHVNPFYNKMDVFYVMSIDRTNYPIHMSGKLNDPTVHFLSALPKFLYDNTISPGSKAIHYLTLGLIDGDEEIWLKPAKVELRQEE